MNLDTAEDDSAREIHIPAEIDWHMLDKSKFFFLGAGLFSSVSTALYPIIVLKTQQQVSPTKITCLKLSHNIFCHEGFRGFYRGYGTSLMGTIPARALYMGALEITKSNVGSVTMGLGFSETAAMTLANGAAGVSSAMAAQLVWTPIDIVSQRLMVQGCNYSSKDTVPNLNNPLRYSNGIDAFRKIIYSDGLRGLYRGFGISILTYAPSNAVWWTSYSLVHRLIWTSLGCNTSKKDDESSVNCGCGGYRPDQKAVVAIQGLSASMASGVSAVITMPLDTIKTRLQVLDGEENGQRKPLTVLQTVKNLVKEGGLRACYRGLGPRWVSTAMSATTMITTYEFLKRLSAKNQDPRDGEMSR